LPFSSHNKPQVEPQTAEGPEVWKRLSVEACKIFNLPTGKSADGSPAIWIMGTSRRNVSPVVGAWSPVGVVSFD